MHAFQANMQIAFEQLHLTQDIHEAQLAEIVESSRHYADKLAYHRASIDHKEVMLDRLCSRFLPDQGSRGSGSVDFGLQ